MFKLTLAEWNDDNASHLAAALAYYTIFSMTPLLVIGVAIAGAFFGRDATMTRLVSQVERYTYNTEAAAFVGTLVENARRPGASLLAGVIGFLMLFYGASGTFYELKTALNRIWDVPRKGNAGIWILIVDRLATLAMVLISGFFMLASLVISTVIMAGARWIDVQWPGMGSAPQIASFLLFFAITLIMFALIYKYVPDIRIAWSDIWIGATATALLFSLGRLVISLYLSQSAIASTYGAAGSLAAILIWIFYSAQLFFLGAEFTQVYGRTYGSRQREAQLVEEPEMTDETALTVEEPNGTIVPIEQATEAAIEMATETAEAKGVKWKWAWVRRRKRAKNGNPPVADTDANPDAALDADKGKKRPNRRRKFARPLLDIAVAATVLIALSVYTVLRQPFRRD